MIFIHCARITARVIDGSTGRALTAEMRMAHAEMRVPTEQKLAWFRPETEGQKKYSALLPLSSKPIALSPFDANSSFVCLALEASACVVTFASPTVSQ